MTIFIFMRFYMFIAFSLTMLSNLLHARIGDTERECFARYGGARPLPVGFQPEEELIPGAVHQNFFKNNWLIRVAYLNGRVAAEKYKKIPPITNGFAITAKEMNAILEAEKDGGIWKRMLFVPGKGSPIGPVVTQFLPILGQKIWARSTDDARAATSAGSFHLYIWTPEAETIVKREAAKKEAAR
jgi:hypothetical protein